MALKTWLRWAADYLQKRSATVTAVATVVIAIATIVYVIYARAQWNEMNQALRQSRDALQITERAYVNLVFVNGKLMDLLPLKAGQPIMIAIHLQNSGHLPATRVVLNYGIGRPMKDGTLETRQVPFRHITNCDPRQDDLTKHPDWVESIIPANAVETRYLFVPNAKLSNADIDVITTAGGEISVIGFLEYCDGFGRVQCVTFCASYKSDARKDFVPCLRGSLNYCPEGFGPPAAK